MQGHVPHIFASTDRFAKRQYTLNIDHRRKLCATKCVNLSPAHVWEARKLNIGPDHRRTRNAKLELQVQQMKPFYLKPETHKFCLN